MTDEKWTTGQQISYSQGNKNIVGFTRSLFSGTILAATDGQVVKAGVSVTWNVLSWSGGHEFEFRLGGTWGV